MSSRRDYIDRVTHEALSAAGKIPTPQTAAKPDPACHETGWSARKIDGRWCVGMTGNLDTMHDAVLIVNQHASDDAEAERIARWIAAKYTSASPATLDNTAVEIERLRAGLREIIDNDDAEATADDLMQHDRNAGYLAGARDAANIARATLTAKTEKAE